jgi:membrane associated rhomboid family serine protease
MNDAPRQPILNAPGVVRALIIVNILVHFRQFVLSDAQNTEVLRYFAFIPLRFKIPGIWDVEGVSLSLSPLTYMFLHGDGMHLLINMLFMLAFGTAVARRMSWQAFSALYLITGVVSALFWMLLHGDSTNPLVGASGALSGAVGALVRISVAPRFIDPRHQLMPPSSAWLFAAFFVGMNLLFALLSVNFTLGGGAVAWEAHVGGFLIGFALGRLFDGRGRTFHPPEW